MILPLLKESNMKKNYIFIFVLFKNQVVVGQYLLLSYPVFQGVYQRNALDNASIPVSGQMYGFPSSTTGSYKIECITRLLNSTGSVIGPAITDLITNNTFRLWIVFMSKKNLARNFDDSYV
jgi:hypothetical protein